VSATRLLTWCRLLVGAGFMYQGLGAHTSGMHETAALFAAHPGWEAWPIVRGMRPYEVTIWLAFVEMFLGLFIFGGLFTRPLAFVGAVVSLFEVLALGLAGGLLAPLLGIGSLLIVARGGGTGTMESALGKMQRMSIERQRQRDEARRAEREAARLAADEQDAPMGEPASRPATPRTGDA
jgi:uncharacterized membrane protein YphA (DoxX/SURF4 family)